MHLGDFSFTPRALGIAACTLPLGVITAFLAYSLLKLIALFTNLFFYQRFSLASADPASANLGLFLILVPTVGAAMVGLMARYGSERIRGHGIPEAIEAILINGSRVDAKVALLKPLSAAISIGSGGPFGAEGPIIMTGGAFGSLGAKLFHLTDAERKILLVSGAVGGMSATFASPVAAVMLAVELLLFEWKPRSLIPVATCSITAFLTRRWLLGRGPVFPVHATIADVSIVGILACCLVGLAAGLLSMTLTSMVYKAEDAFQRLPFHWMWWPLLGGLCIGIGGLILPRALGVGYGTIDALLQGQLALRTILLLLVVKSLIWSLSLGSGTSGGVLAPLLMMGAALGGVEAGILPREGIGYWPLVSMAAVLGGTMRCPLTAIIFAIELTGQFDMLVPLLVAVLVAYTLTVMFMRRSILTEKISRRGLHLSREYAVDPLELHFVREVMQANPVVLHLDVSVDEMEQALQQNQEAFPLIDGNGVPCGLIDRGQLDRARLQGDLATQERASPPLAFGDEPLRHLANRMARTHRTQMLVLDRLDPLQVAGVVTFRDLLKAYAKNVESEEHRARHITLGWRRSKVPNQ